MNKRRVLIISLDGGSWANLGRLADEGYMPNLARLISTGSSGVLKSTLPPLTPVAWSSFLTGVNPGKHGVISFGRLDKDFRSSGLVDRTVIKAVDLWRYASDNGKRVISINVPMTYPPQEINGIMVTGMFTPNMEVEFTNPPEFKGELLRIVPQYEVFPDVAAIKSRPHKNVAKFVNSMAGAVDYRAQAATYLLEKEDWDLCMLHIQETDLLQHPLWGYLDPVHPLYDEGKNRFIATRFYAKLDGHIGRVLACAQAQSKGDDLLTLILSDHGFQSNFRSVNLQKWMWQQGWTRLKNKGYGGGANILRRVDVFNLRKHLLKKGYREKSSRMLSNGYDLGESLALSAGTNTWGFIKLLDTKPSDRERLTSQLHDLRDPQGGQRIVKRVLCREEIYQGPEVHTFPDFILEPDNGYTFSRGGPHDRFIRSVSAARDYHVGTHDVAGIIIAQGNGVKCNSHVDGSITDMFPTILYYLGLGIPSDIDGEVLDIFADENKRGLTPTYSRGSAVTLSNGHNCPTDEREIIHRLKNIGYL